MSLQVIAFHGWAGDQRGWAELEAAARRQGWPWSSADRGYGDLPPLQPAWQADRQRVLIVHSLGLHLAPAELLEQAQAVVLLASFGRFVPEGAGGRRLRTGLAGMRAALQGSASDAEAMLRSFLSRAAAPASADPGWLGMDGRPLPEAGRQRLLDDLNLLGATSGLPEAFPRQSPVLIVEAGQDQIVVPETRALLREALPNADLLRLNDAGHCLLHPGLAMMLQGWLAGLTAQR